LIFEHISTFDIIISNSTTFYSYQSVIKKGYGNFTPFVTKEYQLAELVCPIKPFSYQRYMEIIRKGIHLEKKHLSIALFPLRGVKGQLEDRKNKSDY
jgi:hypothetical protein